MFLRTKLDLHIAAFGHDHELFDDILPKEAAGECEDSIVEAFSSTEWIHGLDGSDLSELQQQVAWAGLNRQLLTCHKGPSGQWAKHVTLSRMVLLAAIVCLWLVYDHDTGTIGVSRAVSWFEAHIFGEGAIGPMLGLSSEHDAAFPSSGKMDFVNG